MWLDKHIVGDKNIIPRGDIFSKVDEHTNVFVPPLIKIRRLESITMSKVVFVATKRY